VDFDLPVYTLSSKNELVSLVATLPVPDFLVVMAYGMILPQPVLDWPKVASINVHASLLPKYRGASPIQSTLLNGDQKIGNCYMQMTVGLDEGPLYMCTEVELTGKETAADLFESLSDLSSQELPNLLVEIASGSVSPIPQQGEPSVCTKINKADGELILADLSAQALLNRYRAYTPWPGVFWFDGGKRVIIRSLNFEVKDLGLSAGEVKLVDSQVWLGTTTDAIALTRVQLEGKPAMDALSWWNGR
ncbi:hypothetical protein COY06_02160, partial [Candidatus Peregrinibacteria bacterium CG_4_10_14_0_2_um_filter_41_8]